MIKVFVSECGFLLAASRTGDWFTSGAVTMFCDSSEQENFMRRPHRGVQLVAQMLQYYS